MMVLCFLKFHKHKFSISQWQIIYIMKCCFGAPGGIFGKLAIFILSYHLDLDLDLDPDLGLHLDHGSGSGSGPGFGSGSGSGS